ESLSGKNDLVRTKTIGLLDLRDEAIDLLCSRAASQPVGQGALRNMRESVPGLHSVIGAAVRALVELPFHIRAHLSDISRSHRLPGLTTYLLNAPLRVAHFEAVRQSSQQLAAGWKTEISKIGFAIDLIKRLSIFGGAMSLPVLAHFIQNVHAIGLLSIDVVYGLLYFLAWHGNFLREGRTAWTAV